MKRQTKKILLIAAVVLALFVLVAGLIMLLRKDAFGDNHFTRNKAVATVNGASISKNEYASSLYNYYNNIDNYNMYAMYYGIGKYYDTSSEAGMKSLKNDILNDLIDDEVHIQMAKELGLTLTSEEQAEVTKEAKETLTNLKNQILESAKSSGSQNPETYAASMLANYYSNMGINQKTFLARAEHAALAEKCASKVKEHYAAERNVTEDELKDIYAEYVKEHYQDAYEEGAYAMNTNYVLSGYTEIPYLYIPEDFLFVQVIETDDAEKAEDMLAKIQAGEDFETFRTSEDNKSEAGKALKAHQGQAIGEHDSVFDDVVYATAKDMELNAVKMAKAVTKDDDGNDVDTYYLIKRVVGNTGVVPYEEVKSVIDSSLKSHEESEYYNEKFEAWRDKADIVIDEDAVASYDPSK